MESGCRDKSRPTAVPGITTTGEQTKDECVLSRRTTLTFDTGWISSSVLLLGSINLPDIASAGLDATGYAVEGCDPCFQMPATRQHTRLIPTQPSSVASLSKSPYWIVLCHPAVGIQIPSYWICFEMIRNKSQKIIASATRRC